MWKMSIWKKITRGDKQYSLIHFSNNELKCVLSELYEVVNSIKSISEIEDKYCLCNKTQRSQLFLIKEQYELLIYCVIEELTNRGDKQ